MGKSVITWDITPVYEKKVEDLKKELSKPNNWLGIRLIDIVFVEDADAIATIRRHIVRRIQAGVGQSYMVQLSLLHKMLTIFLRRTGYL